VAAVPPGYADAYCGAVAALDSSATSLRAWGAAVRADDPAAAGTALDSARASLDEVVAIAAGLPDWGPANTIPLRLAEAVDLRRRVVDEVTGSVEPLDAPRRSAAHALAARARTAMYRAAASWDLVGGVFGTPPCPTDPDLASVTVGGTKTVLGIPATWRTIPLDRPSEAAIADLPADSSLAHDSIRGLLDDVAGSTDEDWLVAVTAAGPAPAYLAATTQVAEDPYQALADTGAYLAPMDTAEGGVPRADFTVGPASALRVDDDLGVSDRPGSLMATTVVAVTGLERVDVLFLLTDLASARSHFFDVESIVFSVGER
jgi:hypothetical protein